MAVEGRNIKALCERMKKVGSLFCAVYVMYNVR